MPDSPLVTLTVWHPASEPPEEKARFYQTDLGLLYLRAFASKVEWVELDDEGHAHVQHPSVYCEDPLPPGGDALTVDGLRRIADRIQTSVDFGKGHKAHVLVGELARLRRALEQIGHT